MPVFSLYQPGRKPFGAGAGLFKNSEELLEKKGRLNFIYFPWALEGVQVGRNYDHG